MSDPSNKSTTFLSKIFTFIVASALLIKVVSPVRAADSLNTQLQAQILQQSWGQLQADFANTGDNSSVQNNATETDSTISTVENTALIDQSVTAQANTGYNEASRNISIGGNAGIITTGDARVQTALGVEANNSTTGIVSGGSAGDGGAVSLANTGDDSSFSDATSQLTSTVVIGINNAVISQTANTTANTGSNVADRNISIGGGAAGVITTGNASTGVGFLVAANNSVALIGGVSDDGGPGTGASIVRTNTGDNGTFTFGNQFSQALAASSQNTAYVNQSCGTVNNPCSAITGGNVSDRGIAFGGNAGVISTAPANVLLQYLATVNPTQQQITGSSAGVAQAPTANLANTGDTTTVADSSSIATNTQISTANSAVVEQTAHALADTGHNTANRNISIGGDAGVITTGNALVDVMMFVFANPTVTSVLLP
jgi:hypothetical protein